MHSVLIPPPKVSAPMLLDRPWARVKHPTPIPASSSGAELMALEDREFAELIRDQVAPRQINGPVREAWGKLWVTLGSTEPELAERTFDVLDELIKESEEALASGRLDDAQSKRARKFQRFCEEAWNRLETIVDQPLGWAGRAAARFNPSGRVVIARLVEAITTHREHVTGGEALESANEALWSVLRDVRLDPDMYR